jgi:hypothetical protein
MKKQKIFLSLEAIKDNPKAMKLYNKTIGKLNAINGIHPIEHPDGMGGNTRTQWPFGSSQRLPKQKPFDRSNTHTTSVSKEQIAMLQENVKNVTTLSCNEDLKKAMIAKSKLALSAISDSPRTNKRPLTEYELLNILHSKGTTFCIFAPTKENKKHTSQYEKKLCKQMGRRRANERIRRNANQYQSEQEPI